ncbi:MAG: 3-hydroxyacyl-CoA dehydrogenase [Coxiellaceae bacterium]|nr:3-hydroxyacyl-CoA dehydrogenase [Coxiellaceae bacterium]
MDIQNKHIVVTGAASGLGFATAEYCHSLGATVIALDKHFNQEDGAFFNQAIDRRCVDVTSSDGVKDVIEEVILQYGAIDAVVNCAGIAPAQRMVGRDGVMDLEFFEEVISVNLIGTFNVMRIAASYMMSQDEVSNDRERGVIINTASVAAFEGQVGQSAYSASKGGVVAMTLPLARELASWGIRVMAIAPGIMKTPMSDMMSKKVQSSLLNQTVYPKRLGHALEFAQLAVHIINNPFLNGEVIRLDGAVRLSA